MCLYDKIFIFIFVGVLFWLRNCCFDKTFKYDQMSKLRAISTTLPIVQKDFNSPSDCTAKLSVLIRPKNWFWRLLSRFGLIFPDLIIVEIETGNSSFIVETTINGGKGLYFHKAFVRTKRGKGVIRILYDPQKMGKHWELSEISLQELEN